MRRYSYNEALFRNPRCTHEEDTISIHCKICIGTPQRVHRLPGLGFGKHSWSEEDLKKPCFKNFQSEPLDLSAKLKSTELPLNPRFLDTNGFVMLDLPRMSAMTVSGANGEKKVEFCTELLTSGLAAGQESASRLEFVAISASKEVTLGNRIDAPGPLILNQYVDISNGLPQQETSESLKGLCECRGRKRCKCFKGCPLFIIFIFLITVIAAVLLSMYTMDQGEPLSTDEPPRTEGPFGNYQEHFVPRSEWAVTEHLPFNDLHIQPARLLIVAHTTGTFCTKKEVCSNIVRSIENDHVYNQKYSGIGFNFLIGGDGFIYEGRGWGKEGAHTISYNCHSIGVAFIGNFNFDHLSDKMTFAFNLLASEGLRSKNLNETYKLFAQYTVKNTISPGHHIIRILPGWPHWSNDVTEEDKICKGKGL